MSQQKDPSINRNFIILGIGIIIGLASLGMILRGAVVSNNEQERTITVKGLAEEEQVADVVIWPIQYTEANNQLADIYLDMERSQNKIKSFLFENGLSEDEISVSTPSVTDKAALEHNGDDNPDYRYVGKQTVTVHSEAVLKVREVMGKMEELGMEGITLAGAEQGAEAQYLVNNLNEIKPKMIEESTTEARKAAQEYAEHSESTISRIKSAEEGDLSISSDDTRHPHIKKIRLVSTVEFYLSD